MYLPEQLKHMLADSSGSEATKELKMPQITCQMGLK